MNLIVFVTKSKKLKEIYNESLYLYQKLDKNLLNKKRYAIISIQVIKMDLRTALNILKTQLNDIHDQLFSGSLILEDYATLMDKLNTLNSVLIEIEKIEINKNKLMQKVNIVYKLAFVMSLILSVTYLILNPILAIIEILIALLLKRGINQNKKESEIFEQNMKELESLLKDVEYKQDISQKKKKLLEKKMELQKNDYREEKIIPVEIPKVPSLSQTRVLRLQKK